MAKKNYKTSDFIGRFKSQHICESCGSVMYHANVFMKGLYCLTLDCEKALPSQFEVVEPSPVNTPQLFGDLEQERKNLNDEIRRWDRGFLVRNLVATRSQVFRTMLSEGMINISELLAVDKLLLIVNQVGPDGDHKSLMDLPRLGDQALTLNENESNVEDLQLGRMVPIKSRVMSHDNDGFFVLDLAYMRVFNSDLRFYGLVSSATMTREEIDEIFTYADIDFSKYGIEDDKDVSDAVRRFESMAPSGIQLARVYGSHYWSAKMHRHGRNPLALSTLYGWFLQSVELNERYLNHDPELEETLDGRFSSVSGSSYTGADFITEYVDSPSLVPYAPRCPDGLLLDRMTLLMMCIYMYVQDVPAEYQDLSGYDKFQQIFASKRSDKFVDRLENRLHLNGYEVPIKEKNSSCRA